MLKKLNLNIQKVITIILGIIVIITGVFLTYISWSTPISEINPGVFTPLGVIITIAGVIILYSWEN